MSQQRGFQQQQQQQQQQGQGTNQQSPQQQQQQALISNEDVKKLQEMGFKTSIIYKAAEIAQAENKHILDVVIQLQENEPTPQPPKNPSQQRSFQEFSSTEETHNQPNKKQQDYDVLTIDLRLRSEGTPVGLLNYGNTCYFNSLIQTYFFIPKFMETIMNYRSPSQLNLTTLSQEKQRRIQASINLVNHLQRLFGYLILSDKKYADPKQVLENIVDDQGNRIILGDQKDIGEFNLQFLERLQEGLSYQEGKIYDFNNQNGSANKQQSICVDLLKNSSSDQKRGSLKKKISFLPSEDEDSIISQLYFGKKKEFITYYQEGTFKQFHEENVFSPIILDLQHQDLYTSWENHNTFYIDDFKDNTGKVTEAEKAGWITKCPEVLMFQIQRVVYLKDKGVAEKLNTPFYFEKEIYIDRFLLDNRAYILRNKPKLKALKKKRDDIMKQLQSLKNYQNSNFSILNVMQMQIDYLNTKESEFIEPNIEDDKFSPKTQSLLSGDNYLEISDFTLDTYQQSSARSMGNGSQNSSNAPIDLLSLFSSPVPQQPLTPSSQSQLQSTIFDRNDIYSQSSLQNNSIQSIPAINNISPPKQDGSNANNHNKDLNLIEPQQIILNQDPRMIDINSKIGILNNNKLSIQNQFLQVLEGLKMQTQDLINSLEAELLRTNKEIDDIYENLKQTKYVLHAILVHQGYADSGHYFSYIYSQDQKKWYKFNDIQVLEEQESVVMQQAVGDGRSSAYCLVYVKENLINVRQYKHTFELMGDNECAQKITEITTSQGIKKKQIVIDLLNLDPDPPVNAVQHIQNQSKKDQLPVKNLVQEYLKAEILSQNRQQQIEMQQFKQLQLADLIVENYSKRFSYINEYIRKTYDKAKKISSCPPLTNFGVYIRWLNENVTDLLKIQLLDCSVREISNQKMILQDVSKNQILQNRLANNFESMGEFKSPGKIVLAQREYDFINKEYAKYSCKVASAYAILEAFEHILNNNVIGSFDYFHYIQQYNTNQNDYFYRMSRDMFKVLLLKSSCSLFEQLDEPNEVILKQIKFILLYCAKLPESDTTSAQIYKILCDYMKYVGNTKLSLQREKLQTVIGYLLSYDKLQEQFKSYLFQQEKRFEELDTKLMQQVMSQDKYFWKIEDVNLNMEYQINQVFSQINVSLRVNLF